MGNFGQAMAVLAVPLPTALHLSSHWAIPESIHTPPMDGTELGTKKFQDFQEGQLQFLQDSRAC